MLGFGGTRIGLSQFALNRSNLLAQIELALVIGERGYDIILNLGTQPEHLQFAAQKRQQPHQSRFDGWDFEQVLAFFQAQIEIAGNQVRQAGRILGVQCRHFDLFGKGGQEFDDFLILALSVARQGSHFDGVLDFVTKFLDSRDQIRLFGGKFDNVKTAQSLDQQANRVVGKLEHL